MQIFYHYRVIETQRDYHVTYTISIQISLISIFLVGSFFLSNLLAKCVQIGKMIWEKNQFVTFSRKVSTFIRSYNNTEIPRSVALSVQIGLVILLEWSPFLIGFIFLLSYGSFEAALRAFIAVGSFSSLSLILIWWIAGVLENFKRFFLFFILRRNIFEDVQESNEDNDEDGRNEKLDISTEMNIWVIIGYLCCMINLLPEALREKFKFKMKHFWIVVGCFLVVVILLTIGIFRQWQIFLIMMVISFCIFIDVILNYLVKIPKHSPSRFRLKSAWSEGLIQRYIAIIEEGFYHSPYLIFSHTKYISYSILIVIATCITLELTQMYIAFIVPAVLLSLMMLFYILRFNLKKATPPNQEQPLLYEDAPSTDHLHEPNEHPVFRILSVLMFSFLCITGSLFFIIFSFVFLGEIPGVAQLILVFLSSFFLFKRYDRHASNSHTIFFSLLVILLSIIFVVGNYNQQQIEKKQYGSIGIYTNRTAIPYGICTKSWEGFNIIDYGFLSALAYEYDPYFTRDFNLWFPNCTGCTITTFNETVSFYDLYIPEKNLSIISVRGTHLLVDWIQDLDIWKEIGLLQVASLVGPFVSFWPEEFTSSLIYWVSALEELLVRNRKDIQFYYEILDRYVKKNLQTRKIILTGHSLGGGISNIVGARNKLLSVTFSAPGLLFSRHKLKIDLAHLNSASVNVIPDNDLVAKIDKSAGLSQSVDCAEGFVSCHNIQRTIQQLIRSCGSDELGRWISLDGSQPKHKP